MRINKYIALSGQYSRRQADKLIQEGQVTLNGKKASLGDQVNDGDIIAINKKPIKTITDFTYIAFNKPFGVITTTNVQNTNTIMDYIDLPFRLFPVGRLDVHSTGLIILTNDGNTAQTLTKSKNGKEKEYLVTLNKPIINEHLEKMEKGIILDNGLKTLPAKVKRINQQQFSIILTQGMNRQVRRMCETLGYEVKILKLIRVAGVKLDDLPRGKWRHLTEKEISSLK
jgi:23S rRNA pseudouridine2604 synthase